MYLGTPCTGLYIVPDTGPALFCAFRKIKLFLMLTILQIFIANDKAREIRQTAF